MLAPDRPRIMATIYAGGGSRDREGKNALHKKLQVIILRAAFQGYLEVIQEAIEVLSSHYEEDQPHDGKQLLDFFPDKDSSPSVSTDTIVGSICINGSAKIGNTTP